MSIIKTKFPGLVIYKRETFTDKRGYFRELFLKKDLNKKFVFDYYSFSKKNTIRGLHLQTTNPQDKLIIIIKGKILDICIDLRKNSKTYLKTYKKIISEKDGTSLFVPKGFAHGFLALSYENIVLYKNTNYRSKSSELTIDIFDDDLYLELPKKKYILSKKDNSGMSLKNFRKKYLNEK